MGWEEVSKRASVLTTFVAIRLSWGGLHHTGTASLSFMAKELLGMEARGVRTVEKSTELELWRSSYSLHSTPSAMQPWASQLTSGT